MKVYGPYGNLFIRTEEAPFKKYVVMDSEGTTLFETEEGQDAEVAIQWAIDYQSSEG